jgi:hypothetical protein
VNVRATDVILLVLGICLLGIAFLVWQNRGSEKIMSAVIPAGFAAAAAIFLAIVVFGQQQPVAETFPAAFHYVSSTKLPWFAPWGIGDRWISDSYLAPAKLKEDNPSTFAGKTDADGMLLYHYLLQWSAVRWMATAYGANWKAEILHFDLPDSREGSYRSTRTDAGGVAFLSAAQIQSALQRNPFATVSVGLPPTIALPPGTQLRIKVPQNSSDTGEISLVNNLFTLTIQTTCSQYKHSAGTYAKLAGLSEAEDQALMKVVFLIKARVEFNRWKSGNPEMADYQAWANQFLTEFKDSFDEQVVWARVKNDYLLRRQIEQLGPMK